MNSQLRVRNRTDKRIIERPDHKAGRLKGEQKRIFTGQEFILGGVHRCSWLLNLTNQRVDDSARVLQMTGATGKDQLHRVLPIYDRIWVEVPSFLQYLHFDLLKTSLLILIAFFGKGASSLQPWLARLGSRHLSRDVTALFCIMMEYHTR